MNEVEYSKELIRFIKESPSMYHTVAALKTRLDKEGFQYIKEEDPWDLKPGGKYYTTRNHSSLIAFVIGKEMEQEHFQISAVHSDSPTFKIKQNPIKKTDPYITLNVEGYGGMIDSTWLDRPLSVAGRIFVQDKDKVTMRLVSVDKDVLMIPNLAIHMNRSVNDGMKYNHQIHLSPLFTAGACTQEDFLQMIAEQAGVRPEQILSTDLFLVNRQQGSIWGYQDEFVSVPKLDDLQSVYGCLQGFIQSENDQSINVYCCFDNEEVGSNTKQGAMSTFLSDTLRRIHETLGYPMQAYHPALAHSFLVSCDNAHALHPNYPEKSDEQNHVYLNQGVVIKESANQKYMSDGAGISCFKSVCNKAGVPYQSFANRSDMTGGSTLGNLSNIQVSLYGVDIGCPQLAMHSSYETAGVKDTMSLITAMKTYYDSLILVHDDWTEIR